MLIGELSKRTGFSRDTIRFYEKAGLISVGRKDRKANNYKDYSEEILRKLLIIKKLKGFGFTLNESSDLLAMMEENEASCTAVSEKVEEKIEMIDQKIAELQEIRNMITHGVSLCLNGSLPSTDRNCTMFIPEAGHHQRQEKTPKNKKTRYSIA